LVKALGYFQQAIRVDPRYAAAYEGLAKCNLVLSLFNAGDPRQLLEQGKQWAAQAVELDPASGNPRATLALLHARADWNWKRATDELERALQLSPDDAQVLDSAALVFICQGRIADTLRAIEKALELEPMALQLRHHLAWFLLLSRRYDEVLEQTRQIIELDAGYPFAYFWRGIALERMSRYAKAEENLRRAIELFGGGISPPFSGALAHCLAGAGRTDEAQDILMELENLPKHQYAEAFAFSLVHLGLGNHDKALHYLEQGADSRSAWLTTHIVGDARLDPLRATPRFQQLLARMGLSAHGVADLS